EIGGMTKNPTICSSLFARHQTNPDWEGNVRADFQRMFDEQLEHVAYRSFGRVFDGDDPVVGDAALDLLEDVAEGGLRQIFHTVAEFSDRGLVRPGADGSEVGDFEI